jgi:TatD DNase family protein
MFIDAHTHLAKYEENLFEVINEIEENEIITLSVSMDTFLFQKNLQIAETCKYVIPSFGVHPWSATHYSYKLGELVEPIKTAPVIGEIGLDFYFVEDSEKYEHQRQVFEFILEASSEMNKIVNLHTKGAEAEIIEYLHKYKIRKSIIHWYSGPIKLIEKFLDLGCYFTFGVELLESKNIQKILKKIPDDKLLTETDNPGAWEWLKNEIGMPNLILNVVDKLAELKKTSASEIQTIVQKNFNSLVEDDIHLSSNIKNMVSGKLY